MDDMNGRRYLTSGALALFALFMFATRNEWMYLDKIWAHADDEDLQPWFAFVRRHVRAGARRFSRWMAEHMPQRTQEERRDDE